MKILLTGGAGFIGSHTAVKLVESGYEIVIAENFHNSDQEIIYHIEEITGEKIPLFQGDVADKFFLKSIFEREEIGAVIHLAGHKAVSESVRRPLMYYRNNLETTISLLEVMENYRCDNLVFCSSATIYGEEAKPPYSEYMGIGRCTNTYGWTKAMGEQIISDNARSNDRFSAVILRIFNPVGAHPSGILPGDYQEKPNNLMPHIMKVATGNDDLLRVFGNDYPTKDGTCMRDYLHVMDLAEATVKAVEYALSHRGVEVFNLGTGKPYSVLDVLEAFERACGFCIPKEFGPRREGDLPVSWADVNKAKEVLEWQSKLTLDDMCTDVWNSYVKRCK